MSYNSFQSRWINLRQHLFNHMRLLITYIIMFTEYILKYRTMLGSAVQSGTTVPTCRGTKCKFCTFVPSSGTVSETPLPHFLNPFGFVRFVVICGRPRHLWYFVLLSFL
jgi:hypothetical protein